MQSVSEQLMVFFTTYQAAKKTRGRSTAYPFLFRLCREKDGPHIEAFL